MTQTNTIHLNKKIHKFLSRKSAQFPDLKDPIEDILESFDATQR